MTGRQLGHYQVRKLLGAGGMGEVYLAEDTRLGRRVALKVLPAQFARDADRLARFEQEARAVAALNHPNIVVLHSIEEAVPDGGTEPIRFLTLELVEGEPLSTMIPRGGLPLSRFFELAVPLADALAAAHDRGVLHRDLKPSNVMVSQEGRVKVLDFGLAKLRAEAVGAAEATEAPTVGPTTAGPVTDEGTILGTVAYMSPEQAEGKPLDQRSDIFSLGVLLYEMATGELPFQGDTRISVLSAIVKDTASPVTEANPNLPRHLGRIVKRCLEKDARRRYQTAADLRNDLAELQREVESGELAPVGSQAGATPSAASSPLVRLAWRATGVLAIALLALLATVMLRGGDELQIEVGSQQRVTADPGLEIHPAISPDGTMIAYAAGLLGQMRIYVRQVAAGTGVEAIPLTEGFPGDHRWPRWSPDSERISFESEGTIYWVPALGGARPRPLFGAGPDEDLQVGQAALGAAWSPDGEQMAYISGRNIQVRTLESGETVRIAHAPAPNSLSWSPDGSWIAYVSGNPAFTFAKQVLANLADSSILLVAPPIGAPVPVTDDPTTLNVSPAWLPDSRHLLFVSDKDGARDVYAVRIGGTGTPAGPPRRLTAGLDAHTLTVSVDGTRMAYSKLTHHANIWALPITQDGTPVSVSEATPVTTGSQTIEGIGVSPDGRWLVFDSNREGNQDIYRMPLALGPGDAAPRSAGPQEHLTTDPSDDFLPSWSPDGQEIAFYSFRNDGQRDLYVMSVDGTEERRVTRDPAQERYPDWSPDGNRLVFYSDKTGRQELWIVSRPARDADWGEPVQLTFDGGMQARWSPDGRWIAFGRQSELWIVRPEGGPARQLVGPSFGMTSVFRVWSPDSGTIYSKGTGRDGARRFWAVPVGGGEPTILVEFDDPSRPSPRPEFATDGERFFFTIADQQSDIWVMELRWR